MSGNTIGKLFTVTTFGESHGPALGCIIDGCPPGLTLNKKDFKKDLTRRATGQSQFTSQRKEPDDIQILSGVFEGKTTGTPIGLMIYNQDSRSKDYENIKDQFRPGHADYTYFHKYGIRDYRGGGRSSARETVMRVAAGVVAKKYLFEHCGLSIQGFVSQIGDIKLDFESWDHVETNPFFCPNSKQLPDLEAFITNLRKEKNSVGAKVSVVANNVPVGLGEPVFDKLDAEIAYALMGINAVKGVEIGEGFQSIAQKGSEHRDQIEGVGKFITNHAGGTLGGISSGQNIVAHIALKPTSSIPMPGQSINTQGKSVSVVTKGRHDPCVGLRAVPIAEAMLAIVLMDHVLRQRAQNLDKL